MKAESGPIPILTLALVGLLLGGVGGYGGIKAWRSSGPAAGAKAADGQTASTGGSGSASAASASATGASAPTGGLAVDTKLSLREALLAATKDMTPEERFAEIERMLGDKSVSPQDMQKNWAYLHLRYQALMRAEDLPKLKEMMLGNQPGQSAMDQSKWPFMTAVIMGWADWDEAGLEQWAKEPNTNGERGFMPLMAAYSLATKWAKGDAFTAWDKIVRLEKELPAMGMMGGGALWAVIPAALKQNPQLTYEKCKAMANPQERQRFLNMVMNEVAKTDFDRAMSMAQEEPEPGFAQELKQGVVSSYIYSSKDPKRFERMSDYILSEEGESIRSSTAWTLVRHWQMQDPKAAKAWMDTNKELLDSYGILENLPGNQDKRKSANELLTEAEALPEGTTERTNALREAYSKLADQDPDGALRKVASLDEKTAGTVIDSLVWNYAQTDPGILAKHLNQLPGDATKTRAMQAVMQSWVDFNPEAASTWLEAQPAGKLRDEGIGSMIPKLENDPAAAAQWALAASTDEKRDQYLAQAALLWKEKDAQAARLWAYKQEMKPESRTKFLKTLE